MPNKTFVYFYLPVEGWEALSGNPEDVATLPTITYVANTITDDNEPAQTEPNIAASAVSDTIEMTFSDTRDTLKQKILDSLLVHAVDQEFDVGEVVWLDEPLQ